MTILLGREIAEHGLPHRETLAVMTQGRRVVDGQWLAQLGFWEIFRAGGMRLAAITMIALLVAPVAVAVRVARRRGASTLAVLPFVLLPLANFTSLLRAQLLSLVLFVALLALLSRESGHPSRRVWLAFPLLVIWANLHGAALVGAGLVALFGGLELLAGRRTRGAFLMTAPWLCLLATPYGLSTASYYASLMHNPAMHAAEDEWRAPTFPSVLGLPLFLLAGIGIALLVKRRRDLTRFELAALAYTFAGALTATRSIPWFAYTCLMLLPPLFDRAWVRKRPAGPPAVRLALAVAASLVAVASLASIALRPGAQLTPAYPAAAADAVSNVLRADPGARVFTSYELPDWLLFVSPEARGRIAYEGRFELLSQAQMRGVAWYGWQLGEHWDRPTTGYRLLMVNTDSARRVVRTYDRRPGYRVLYRDEHLVLYDRGATAG
jgi:uncharacterized membrane protein YhaH (DUF805 family)